MDVLVVNSAYMPLGRISWQKAFTKVWNGQAEVVEYYADRFIRSAANVWPMPSIIRCLKKVKGLFRRGVKFNRKNVYLRDEGRCQYCGHKVSVSSFQFEHVVPRAQGGKTVWENIVVACRDCNQRKGDKTPEQAKMRLLKKPVRPSRVVGGLVDPSSWTDGMPNSWKDYLGSVSYWTDEIDA